MTTFSVQQKHFEGRPWIPSMIAVSKEYGEPLFGSDADSHRNDSHLAINWKLLVGDSPAKVQAQIADDQELAAALRPFGNSVQGLLNAFVKHVLSFIKREEFSELPQILVGIPVTEGFDDPRWRQRYKEHISEAFRSAEFPEPKFFNEAFATFQYYYNRGVFQQTSDRPLNVLIVDIGGGTTNLCLVQTTKQGLLARGGPNKIPHGVTSAPIGGANLDSYLLDSLAEENLVSRSNLTLIEIGAAKERLCAKLRGLDLSALADPHGVQEQEEVRLPDIPDVSLSFQLLCTTFQERFWPVVRDAIAECLSKVQQKNLPLSVDSIDYVILGGGTSQLPLIEYAFKKEIAAETPILRDAHYIVAEDHVHAVADGLAVEALANSPSLQIKPTRTSSFVNTNIQLNVGRSKDDLEPARRLRLLNGECNYDEKRGLLFQQPQNFLNLIGQSFSWSFQLKATAKDIFYEILKEDVEENHSLSSLTNGVQRLTLTKKSQKAAKSFRIHAKLQDDGFLKNTLEYDVIGDSAPSSKEIHPVDLHDLTDLNGRNFLSLDLGTYSTVCSFINADQSLVSALPNEYWADEIAIRNAWSLNDRYQQLMASVSDKDHVIRLFNQEEMKNYVHESNRIERSQLARGQTSAIADLMQDRDEEIGRSPSLIEEISHITESGEVGVIKRPVQDGLAAANLIEAYKFVERLGLDKAADSGNTRRMTQADLRDIHLLAVKHDLNKSPGKFREYVQEGDDGIGFQIGGSAHVPPDYIEVPHLINKFFERLGSPDFESQPPLIQAVEAHTHFVSIHPFLDGNGRVARLLMNYVFWRNNSIALTLVANHRDDYYDALEYCNTRTEARPGNMSDLVILFADAYEDALRRLKQIVDEQNLATGLPVTVETDHHIIDEIAMVPDKPVEAPGSDPLENFLAQLSESPINTDMQYESFVSYFESVEAEIKKMVVSIDQRLQQNLSSMKCVNYEIVNKETYQAMCLGDVYNKTWFLKIMVSTPRKSDVLVFFFGETSRQAKRCGHLSIRTCSLFVSRWNYDTNKYVRALDDDWAPIVEIVFDGQKGKLLEKNPTTNALVLRDPTPEHPVKDWFIKLMEALNLLGR